MSVGLTFSSLKEIFQMLGGITILCVSLLQSLVTWGMKDLSISKTKLLSLDPLLLSA